MMTDAPAERSTITVSAPSRIHFGLIAIGDQTQRKFGGAGLMVAGPRTVVTLSPSDRLNLLFNAQADDCATRAVARWHEKFAPSEIGNLPLEQLPVSVTCLPTGRHQGLGSGTQISFCIAAALHQFFCGAVPSATELAFAMNRGQRSAIGSHGFFRGGFLVDRGFAESDKKLAPLDVQTAFPDSWRVVLIQPDPESDSNPPLHGQEEVSAFENLEPTSQREAEGMIRLLNESIVPAVVRADFQTFAGATTEFGYRSGLYYRKVQGGAYASAWAIEIVRRVSAFGEFAVGQSSWGPTMFAICESEASAGELVAELESGAVGSAPLKTEITTADNNGALWTTV